MERDIVKTGKMTKKKGRKGDKAKKERKTGGERMQERRKRRIK